MEELGGKNTVSKVGQLFYGTVALNSPQRRPILLYEARQIAIKVLLAAESKRRDATRSEGLPCGCKPPFGSFCPTTLTKIVDC